MLKSLIIPHLLALLLAFAPGRAIKAQSAPDLRLDSCLAQARRNFPLIRQYQLLERSRDLSLANAATAYLPRLGVSGQATYQSEVTQLPISFPGVEIPSLSKDQYKLFGEINQSLTSFFMVKDREDLIEAQSEAGAQQVTVSLYALRERVQNLFFGILLLDAQEEQLVLVEKDVEIGLQRAQTAVDNGVALKSAVDQLRAEQLRLKQRLLELGASRQAYVEMLGLLIGQDLPEGQLLAKPEVPLLSESIQRPELQLFALQKRAIGLQEKLIDQQFLPQVSLFFQGGVGRPALNFLSNDLNEYFITGLRLNWNFSALYTSNREKQLLGIEQQGVDVQRELFLFNTRLDLQQKQSELQKIEDLIKTDGEIIALLESVKLSTQKQLELGTASSADYLRAVNEQDRARQQQSLRRIQLLMTQYQINFTTGN